MYSVAISAISGSSFSSAFSIVASNLPVSYHISSWNETSSTVALAIATSTPTSTTTEQFYVPSGGASTKDCDSYRVIVPAGSNLYMRAPNTSNASGVPVIFECW